MYWHVRNTTAIKHSGDNWESELYALEISVLWVQHTEDEV
jgi:hypothetical protein